MAAAELVASHLRYHGWQAARLANRFVQLIAVPDIGGRIMAYDLGDHAFLFVDRQLAGKLFSAPEHAGDGTLAAWKNYGGDKTWPAPQGWETDAQWHGPPDPVLDSGRYRLSELNSENGQAVLSMVSPHDKRTGLEISRRFCLQPATSRVKVALTFRNISARVICWSIWDVMQLCAEQQFSDGSRSHDPSCSVTTLVNPHSRFDHGFQVMFGAPDNPQWQVEGALFQANYCWQIGKVGLDSPAGWIAFQQGSTQKAIVQRFTYLPGADYPDGGVTVECWTVGAGEVANLNYADSKIYLMETEVLSPLYTLTPNATANFALEWASCACDGPVVDVQAGGCAAQRLTVYPVDQVVQLGGHFGVFDAGELQVAWHHSDGRLELRETLGKVNPLQTVVLNHECVLPPPQVRIALYVKAEADACLRLLAQN